MSLATWIADHFFRTEKPVDGPLPVPELPRSRADEIDRLDDRKQRAVKRLLAEASAVLGEDYRGEH